jgi:undecaprenyl-diphosphatase
MFAQFALGQSSIQSKKYSETTADLIPQKKNHSDKLLLANENIELDNEHIPRDSLNDLLISFSWFFKGSYLQFSQVNNLYYLPPAIATTWYAFEEDERVSAYARSRELKKHVDLVGDLGVVFNFPIIPAGFYYWGRYTKNHHAVQFGMEYFAALYLTLAESGVLSFIDIHERPDKGELSFWETQFRGDSSWPSGHIIPYTTLFFKTLQFYGPYWAILPFVGSILSSQQRVQDGKHWLSDVVASFWLSAFASEGVRAAAKYKKNHPFYKWIFEREARIGIIHHQNKIGPRFVWNF